MIRRADPTRFQLWNVTHGPLHVNGATDRRYARGTVRGPVNGQRAPHVLAPFRPAGHIEFVRPETRASILQRRLT
jgi:hypothetical protein